MSGQNPPRDETKSCVFVKGSTNFAGGKPPQTLAQKLGNILCDEALHAFRPESRLLVAGYTASIGAGAQSRSEKEREWWWSSSTEANHVMVATNAHNTHDRRQCQASKEGPEGGIADRNGTLNGVPQALRLRTRISVAFVIFCRIIKTREPRTKHYDSPS
ncbi:unnamed protein product, partial [Hapterophycus canaliculatus]